MRVLVLGGTGEARRLAEALVAAGDDVTTSLAGRTRDPYVPRGDLRVGKFGGVPGLSAYLKAGGFDFLIDATHPYAALMSANAVAASAAAGIPLLRLCRPPWTEPDGAGWQHVADAGAAAAALPAGATVLLTTGHTELERFLQRSDCRFLVRLIEPPGEPLPSHAELLLARPPYLRPAEEELMRQRGITHLVSKNSGGEQTAAKLAAAAALGIRVIMVTRPPLPPAEEVASVEAALLRLHPTVRR